MPKVSVIVPNYNHARFLEQRLQTILKQTYQDFDVIYLDDASTDESNVVFAPFASNEKIRSICNRTNSGSPFIQWNRGVREATGEYIWIAEADDYADERLLATLVEQLDANSDAGIAYCQSMVVDQSGNLGGSLESWTSDLDAARWKRNFVNDGKDECARFLIRKNTIPNASAVVFRRSVFEKCGHADASMRLSGDWMTWAKMLLISEIAFVAEPLNYFRQHDASVRHSTGGVILEERYRIAGYIRNEMRVPEEVIEQVCEDAANEWIYPWLANEKTISLGRHREIMRSAKGFDHRILFRLTTKAWRYWLYCGAFLGPLRAFVRSGKRLLAGILAGLGRTST